MPKSARSNYDNVFNVQERDHPAGDECCVLWVCADQTELKLDPELNINSETHKNDGGVDDEDIPEDENDNGRNDLDSNEFPAFNDQIPSKDFLLIDIHYNYKHGSIILNSGISCILIMSLFTLKFLKYR